MNAASAIRPAFFSILLLVVSTSWGEIVSYSDKGLAASYEGLSFSAGTYPSATYKDSDNVTHSTVWLTDTDCPTSLTSLAAGLGETSLKVYTMTDSVDGTRLAPQYDELLQLP